MNRYSALTIALLIFANVPCAYAAERKVTVQGSSESWVSSGVVLDGKKRVKVKASGLINYCSGGSQCDATPDGSVGGESHCQSGTNAPFALCGALIARVAGGTPFVVGTGVTLPKSSVGALEFSIQDFKFDDNSGQFNVTVSNVPKEKFTLSGYVLTSGGQPFPGERILVTSGRKRYAATTDVGGFYALELEEGNYTVAPVRQNSVPPTFVPQSGTDRALFAPLRIRLSLSDDAHGQNFTSVRFATETAPFRRVRGNELGLCRLTDAPATGTNVQMMNVPIGTLLRYEDSVLVNVPVRVTARGPYEDVRRRREAQPEDCKGRLYESAGLGVSEQLYANGGAAIIELSPR